MSVNKVFTHIHLHTYFSLLDGMGSPEERVLRAKELGMTALAITDHNHLGGCLEFQAACKKHGLKPLLGVELYWTWDRHMISMSKEERLLQLKLVEMNNFIKKVLEINKMDTETPAMFEASVITLKEFVKYVYNEDLIIESSKSINGETEVITYIGSVCDTDMFEISFEKKISPKHNKDIVDKDEIKEFLKDLLASLD